MTPETNRLSSTVKNRIVSAAGQICYDAKLEETIIGNSDYLTFVGLKNALISIKERLVENKDIANADIERLHNSVAQLKKGIPQDKKLIELVNELKKIDGALLDSLPLEARNSIEQSAIKPEGGEEQPKKSRGISKRGRYQPRKDNSINTSAPEGETKSGREF